MGTYPKITQKIVGANGNLVAGEALTAFTFVKVSNGKLVAAGAGETPVGVVKLAAEKDENVTYYFKSIVPVVASAAIAEGANVSCAASGKAVTTASSAFVVGVCVEAAAAEGDLAMVQLLI